MRNGGVGSVCHRWRMVVVESGLLGFLRILDTVDMVCIHDILLDVSCLGRGPYFGDGIV
jgi:hypothetical protein